MKLCSRRPKVIATNEDLQQKAEGDCTRNSQWKSGCQEERGRGLTRSRNSQWNSGCQEERGLGLTCSRNSQWNSGCREQRGLGLTCSRKSG
eukprot:244352-Chlamydomonas_euryale.AAC.1